MSNEMKDFVEAFRKDVTKHLEMMAAAYIKASDVPIEECELVVAHIGLTTTYRFRRCSEFQPEQADFDPKKY